VVNEIKQSRKAFGSEIVYVETRSEHERLWGGDYETVRELLGHSDISTTMSFYAALDMREVSKRVGKFIAQQRADLAHLAGRRAKKNG
jgi:hypothetical protein